MAEATRLAETDLDLMKAAVRVACKDAFDQGKLGIASAIYAVPEWKLRDYAIGMDDALCETEIRYLAAALKEGA
jgi:hypothetical protein